VVQGYFSIKYRAGLKRIHLTEEKIRRTTNLTLRLNEREARALNIYCQRFRVRSKSDFMRRTIMQAIIGRFDAEHPTLWEQGELTLFSQELKNN
jgi:hypothetical protein